MAQVANRSTEKLNASLHFLEPATDGRLEYCAVITRSAFSESFVPWRKVITLGVWNGPGL